jgi:hypothetical protein
MFAAWWTTWGTSFGYQTVSQQPSTDPQSPTTTDSQITTASPVTSLVTNTNGNSTTASVVQTTPAAPPPTPVSVNVPAPAFNTSLSGSGLNYSLNSVGSATLTGNPVTLTSTSSLTFTNYLNALPVGDKLTGATLNLGMALGVAVTALAAGSDSNPYFVPTLLANPGALTITISSTDANAQIGTISRTISGTSVSAYDLLANGFGSFLGDDDPISITFSLNDSFSATGTYYSSPFGQFFTGTQTESLNYTDTRTLTATNGLNFLTLTATPPPTASPNIPSPPPTDPNPEPVPSVLIGCGLALIGLIRFRKRRRA